MHALKNQLMNEGAAVEVGRTVPVSRGSAGTPRHTSRRAFLGTVVAATAGLATGALAQSGRRNIKLGIDNFAVRAMGWKAPQLIDYAASLKTDSLFITDFNALESLEDKYLKDLRAKAADKGV